MSSILRIKTAKQAAEDAKILLQEERDGKQRGLLCRFESLNRAMLKWWRFGLITQIASMSGGGKSYLLNMLIEDFTDRDGINKEFDGKVLVLHFTFEMRASDELLRTTSRKMEKSYKYLRSSSFEKGKYNTLTDLEFSEAITFLDKYAERPILFVETSGNLNEIDATIDHIANKYKDYKLVIGFDHALLTKRFDEANEIELMVNLANKTMYWTKQYDSMSIILGQLNANIEMPIRRENQYLQYPVKGDIHGSNQIYMACDNVLIAHRPQLLGIERYGAKSILTKDLVHGCLIKSRFGDAGNLWFASELKLGRFRELTHEEKLEKNIISNAGVKKFG